jgi:hypothetical protein
MAVGQVHVHQATREINLRFLSWAATIMLEEHDDVCCCCCHHVLGGGGNGDANLQWMGTRLQVTAAGQ